MPSTFRVVETFKACAFQPQQKKSSISYRNYGQQKKRWSGKSNDYPLFHNSYIAVSIIPYSTTMLTDYQIQ